MVGGGGGGSEAKGCPSSYDAGTYTYIQAHPYLYEESVRNFFNFLVWCMIYDSPRTGLFKVPDSEQ